MWTKYMPDDTNRKSVEEIFNSSPVVLVAKTFFLISPGRAHTTQSPIFTWENLPCAAILQGFSKNKIK